MSTTILNLADYPFREVGFRKPFAELQTREDGVLLLRSGHRLPERPGCTVDWLKHWVSERPDHPMLVERDAEGVWRSISCAQVWAAVRSIATTLVRVGASHKQPLVILSESSTEQALLTWGALYAGVPVAPVSPAYSLIGGNYARLRNAVSLVGPHLVFVEDAQRFAGAVAALDVPVERVIAVDNLAPGMLRFADLARTTIDPDVVARPRELDPAL